MQLIALLGLIIIFTLIYARWNIFTACTVTFFSIPIFLSGKIVLIIIWAIICFLLMYPMLKELWHFFSLPHTTDDPTPLSSIPTRMPDFGLKQESPYVTIPKPIQYEFKCVTVAVGLLNNIDTEVNATVTAMSREGWELMSNTEGISFLSPKARTLQFRRMLNYNCSGSP